MCNTEFPEHSDCDCFKKSQIICPDHSKHHKLCLSLASTYINEPSGQFYVEALDDNDVNTVCVSHNNEWDGICTLVFDRVCSDRSILASDATGKKYIVFHPTVVSFISLTDSQSYYTQ